MMRLIISPAKKMNQNTDIFSCNHHPQFLEETALLLEVMKHLTYEEAKKVWNCNDTIAKLNYERIQNMDLHGQLTPAILAYEGIQYQYMAPAVFEEKELAYIEAHLRILSGFYGMLRPFDGVVPYRLEMQAKLECQNASNLYEFWGNKLAKALLVESDCIVNLASKEYGKCIAKYIDGNVRYITCIFGEYAEGKMIEKGAYVKMARGEMVRFMAENNIQDVNQLKEFNGLGYVYEDESSDDNTFVFCKK